MNGYWDRIKNELEGKKYMGRSFMKTCEEGSLTCCLQRICGQTKDAADCIVI
jgi:hypothetical protein